MNKKYMILGIVGFLAMVFVSAGVYYVNTLTVEVDIGEPFDVIEYAILGDGSSYDVDIHGLCSDEDVVWMTDEVLETALSSVANEYLDAGESRKLCVRIQNNADADIPYVVDFNVTGDGSGNGDLCRDAFSGILSEAPWVGIADKSGAQTIDGKVFTVSSDATPTNNCQITVEVGRGTI